MRVKITRGNNEVRIQGRVSAKVQRFGGDRVDMGDLDVADGVNRCFFGLR